MTSAPAPTPERELVRFEDVGVVRDGAVLLLEATGGTPRRAEGAEGPEPAAGAETMSVPDPEELSP